MEIAANSRTIVKYRNKSRARSPFSRGEKMTSSTCKCKMFGVTVTLAATADSEHLHPLWTNSANSRRSKFFSSYGESIEERSRVPPSSRQVRMSLLNDFGRQLLGLSNRSFRFDLFSSMTRRVGRGKTLRMKLASWYADEFPLRNWNFFDKKPFPR